jgi:hypothetical protein
MSDGKVGGLWGCLMPAKVRCPIAIASMDQAFEHWRAPMASGGPTPQIPMELSPLPLPAPPRSSSSTIQSTWQWCAMTVGLQSGSTTCRCGARGHKALSLGTKQHRAWHLCTRLPVPCMGHPHPQPAPPAALEGVPDQPEFPWALFLPLGSLLFSRRDSRRCIKQPSMGTWHALRLFWGSKPISRRLTRRGRRRCSGPL